MWLGGNVNDRYMSVKEPQIEAMSLKSRNETRDKIGRSPRTGYKARAVRE